MTAGRLAASKPAATTNTTLYRCNIDNTASVVLTAANQSGSAATYRAALRDYDQILTLDGNEPSEYQFQKGNPISAYKLKINPGLTFGQAIPGTILESINGASAKLLDVFKDTSIINRYVKVESVLQTDVLVDDLIGIFEVGETVTGATSSLTGSLRYFDSTIGSIYLAVADVSNVATTVQVSRNTGLVDGTIFVLSSSSTETGTEIITIDPSGINLTTNALTVTRGVYGTTANAIPAGQYAKSFIDSATTTTSNEGATFTAADTTLTVLDSTGFLEGGYARIDNEIIEISAISGNDITVTRGQYGTSAVNHTDGATVTQLTDAGDYYLNFFTETEEIEGGTSGATITMNFSQGATSVINANRFIVADGSPSGTYTLPLDTVFNNERVYRYWQTDASNVTHTFRLSTEQDGTQSLTGVEYTGNVVKVGTAGNPGAYLQITIDEQTPLTLYSYAEPAVANEEDANAGYGWVISVTLNPEYEEIYVYKIAGTPWLDADQFSISATTYTIQANGVTSGPWGYVHDWNATNNVLKISLDGASPAFAVGDQFHDTPTLTDANRTLTEVVTGKVKSLTSIGAADVSRTAGTYPGLSPTGGTGSGVVVDVVVDGSGAATVTLINGGKDYAAAQTLTITDSNLGGGGAANLTFNVGTIGTGSQIGATATNYVEDQDYFTYGTSIPANEADRFTGLVVGPGQNVVVYSSAADISYVVSGFESDGSDYSEILNLKTALGN